MGDKLTVMRANIVLDISPDEKEYYIGQGYSVIDDSGEIIEKGMSSDVGELQIEVLALREEVENLKQKLAKAETKTTKKQSTKSDD